MKQFLVLFVFLCSIVSVKAQNTLTGKIKVYFTKPVDTSVSKGIIAQQLYKSVDDTLIAYINRAKFSLDIAIYNYTYASTIADIAGAINNAFNRGVKVRIIYDGSVTNTGLKNILSGIPMLASPQGSKYNIMHNKFVVIDSKSVNPDDALVWAGSANWSNNMFYLDANNVVIIQDQPLALAYRTEFEEMWGDTGLTPNISNSKFGQYKTDNTQHQFIVDGKLIELYFSPSDNVNSKVINTINTANTDLEFCVLQITRTDVGNTIVTKALENGFDAKGIEDPSGLLTGKAVYDTMKTAMGSNLFTDSQANSLLHHKYLIVDQSNTLSDPLVLTGSHNWTTSANTMNDENTLIIHDSTIANVYYQEFVARFKEDGGVLSVNEMKNRIDFKIYPNPSTGIVNIGIVQVSMNKSTIEILDVLGRTCLTSEMVNGQFSLDLSDYSKGVYFARVREVEKSMVKKIILN